MGFKLPTNNKDPARPIDLYPHFISTFVYLGNSDPWQDPLFFDSFLLYIYHSFSQRNTSNTQIPPDGIYYKLKNLKFLLD